MPHFFFDWADEISIRVDVEGAGFPSADEASEEAFMLIGDVTKKLILEGGSHYPREIELTVRDADGDRVLYTHVTVVCERGPRTPQEE